MKTLVQESCQILGNDSRNKKVLEKKTRVSSKAKQEFPLYNLVYSRLKAQNGKS
jgi:hypothetical protein